ncbi:MAG: hypothetical protein ACLR6B_00800 [Blautia sp.]
MEELIRTGQDAEIGKLLAQAFTCFSEEKIEKKRFCNFCTGFLFKLERKIMPENREGKEKQRENQYENLRKCCCIEEARDYVDGILKIIEEKRNQQLGDCKSAYVVRKVQEYVRSHYSQSVTVEDMAAEIHFSANYIRTIFKEGNRSDNSGIYHGLPV